MINIDQLFQEKFSHRDYSWSENPIMNWDDLKVIPENEREDAILNYALDRLNWVGQESKPTLQDLKTKKAEIETSLNQQAQAAQVEAQKQAAYSAWVANGFNAGGYKLRVSDSDQIAFSKLMSSLMLKNPSDSFEVKIEAMDGSIKTLTYAQFKTLMIAYGDYCYASWKAGKGIL